MDEKQLIQDIVSGNYQKFSILVNRYSRYVFQIAYSLVNNKEDATEITQDTFVKVFEKLANFKGESKFSSYLYRICYNKSINHLKKEKKYFHLEINEQITEERDINNGFFELIQKEQKKYLTEALLQLKEDERLVITLFYLEEMSYNEIVEITGWSLSNVKVKLHRAKDLLAFNINRLLKSESQNLW